MKIRYSVEIQAQSLFQDRTVSWVRIMNGVEKYVTETVETAEDEEHRASGKPIAKARPRVTSTKTWTPVYVLLRERKWMDVNRGIHDRECYFISIELIRLQRHDQNILGKLTAQSIMRILWKNSTKGKGNLEGASQWPLNGFLFWQKEEEPRKGFNID